VTDSLVVRVPASSANLGAGFDVLGMALELHLELGVGAAPDGARLADQHHPATRAFVAAGGGVGDELWIRSEIPMGRGLGFSGAARVGGAALGVAIGADDPEAALAAGLDRIVGVAAESEGHGDNAAASALGGIVSWVDGRAIPLRLGPRLSSASVIVWIPDTTTSTDRSRGALPGEVRLADAVHNLGRIAQFVAAVEHDDPSLLVGATDDRMHQRLRLALVPDAADSLTAGVAAGAWCAWLSGSGPTIAMLAADADVPSVTAALPGSGHVKVLRIASQGVRVVRTSGGAGDERRQIG
jgi:homoserine kinase